MESSILYSTIGFKEIYLGKFDDAIKSLDYSIKLDSSNSWAYSNKALALLKKGKLDLAKSNVNKSIKLDDKNPFAFKHRALLFIAENKIESACNDLSNANQLALTERMSDSKLEEIKVLIKKYCD